MLGSDLSTLLIDNGYEPVVFDLPDFDITKESDIKKIVDESDLIVNCAAYTAVDKAETEKATAYAVNADAVGMLGEFARSAGKYIVHISTDFVFGDESSQPLTEDSPTNPLSVYGASKLKGEELLLKTGAPASIIRVEWTYGRNGNNFIYKIRDLASKLDSMKVVSDQVGAPTPTTEVSRAVLAFLQKKPEGVFLFAADGYASRYETACFIAEQLKLDVKITPCASSEFQAPAERPKNSRFDCSKIDGVLDFKRNDWKSALCAFLNS